MAEEIIDKEIGEVLPMDELEVGTVSIIPMQDAFVHNSDNMVMCTLTRTVLKHPSSGFIRSKPILMKDCKTTSTKKLLLPVL